MPAIEPIIPGIYARSQRLVQTTRDHDRDRVDDETLAEDQARDVENLLGVQTAAGFDLLSPGLVTWQDHFRPFRHVVDGLETDTLTRFLDTNTFYRRPDLEDPSYVPDGWAAFQDEAVPDVDTDRLLFTLPSPTAWVTAAKDEDGSYPDPGLAATIAEEIYPPVIDHLQEQTAGLVFADPWLADHPEPGRLADVLTQGVAAAGDTDVLLQLAFQDAALALAADLADPVDAVIVDLHRTDRDSLGEIPADTGLGLGLVDARSSLVERPDLLLSSLEGAVQRANAEQIYLAPNGSLQHVPETIARRKVRVLGETAGSAAAKLGGGAP